MADLNGRSRGQIILVAAFAMAVIFLGLAIITNAAIYTENLATRGQSADASDALLERQAIEVAGGDVIEAANWNNYASGYATIQDKVEDGIANLEDWEGHHAGLQSTFVSTQYISGSDTEGRRVFQNNGTDFTNFDSSQTNWTVAENVDGVRAFRINVTSTSVLNELLNDPFRVNATNAPTGNNWTMTVADGGVGKVTVEVERESPIQTASCTVPDDLPLHIDVTEATVGGEACPALDIIDGDPMHIGSGVGSNYDLRFENGDAMEGNYSLVVDAASLPSSNYGTLGGAGGQPYNVPAMYDARIQFRYYSPSIDYVTEIRLAPGEPDD